jgi:site-specific recombinase XerD
MKGQIPTIGFLQRSRKIRKDGTAAVYIQVYCNGGKRIYSTGLNLYPGTFTKAWKQKNPRGQYREHRNELESIKEKAEQVARSLEPFTFDKFEAAYFGQSGSDVFGVFRDKIAQLEKQKRWKSASSYRTAANALKDFIFHKGQNPERLSFDTVTPEFLQEFEQYRTETKGQSISTVGVYTRQLKAIFNDARAQGLTQAYPFGKRLYKTPNARKAKRALTANELQTFFNAEPTNQFQQKAKDFFTLSLALYGINLNDLLTLKNRDIGPEQIAFYRGKTANTTRENLTPITIPLTGKAKALLDKYRGTNIDPDALALNILTAEPGSAEAKREITNFTRFVNQHLKRLASANGLSEGLSYQWARHTFATLSVQQGASLEFISGALGHADVKTTEAYFHGFGDQAGKGIIEGIIGE